ncbi:MAG: hypothetical protein K2Y51_09055 [Gammaproteobacteria bacterium]|nr:hypothetical protein [Gammaproteobacteria bacterium]
MPTYWRLKLWKTGYRQRTSDRLLALRKRLAGSVPRRWMIEMMPRLTLCLLMLALCVAHGANARADDLGTVARPVQADMPWGEREYIMRLRCPGGDEPGFERVGSFGEGPHGHILDGYKLTCGQTESMIYIDMYHRGHREQESVPGFTLLRDIPALIATGCPPEVPGHTPGTYVFRPLEVETPPSPLSDLQGKVKVGTEGRAYVGFTIETSGLVDPDSIMIEYLSDRALEAPARDFVSKLQFSPAEHHEACTVPFAVKLGIDFE